MKSEMKAVNSVQSLQRFEITEETLSEVVPYPYFNPFVEVECCFNVLSCIL